MAPTSTMLNYKVEYFKDMARAIKRAREVYPLDAFGSVRVVEQEAERDEYISADIGRAYFQWEDSPHAPR
jgi:hypothetical protein